MPDLLERKKPSSLDEVIEEAWKELESRDRATVAKHSLGELKDGVLEILFLGERYLLDFDERVVKNVDGSTANRFFATLVLHYVVGVDESMPTGELVSFREFWGGESYHGAFVSRAIQPVKDAFAEAPEELKARAEKLGGRRVDHGDVSYEIPVFPKVALTIIIWRGDEEIPGSANMLFDHQAGRILHTEDLAALGELVARMLVR
ncbi:MAG: DUF3786 domain-containing protein [Candidatus Thermoplasmatota archaeon]|nr:DUF3786 domain-containing protein [Candidatus Thermoplasmatota archaeon]